MYLSYILVLGANLCFASSTLVFTHFSHKTNVYWMNMFKALVALAASSIAVLFLKDIVWQKEQLYFFISGMTGLFIGDIFLLKAFLQLGPGRSLVLFSFQPLFIGFASFYLFGQSIDIYQLSSLVFLLACLITFSLENKRLYQSWGIKGLLFAILGVTLDAIGILLTKQGFESSETHFFQAHMIRSLGAVSGFMLLRMIISFPMIKTYQEFTTKQKSLVLLASFCGTFLSLSLYMAAIEIGHLATLSAIAITGPFTASILECVIAKKWPTKYLVVAFFFFIMGFYLLLHPLFM